MDFKTFLDNLNEEITCAICMLAYGQPKMLSCLHTICVDCLNTMAQRAIQGNHVAILCPLCKARIPIPQPHGNFNALPNNIYIDRLKDIAAVREAGNQDVTCGNCEGKTKQASYCFECSKIRCTKCEAAHKIMKEFKEHRVLELKDFHDKDLKAMLQRPAFCQQRDHESKFLEYYCNDCTRCICQMCLSLEHKTHRVQSVQEVSRAYQADIAEQVSRAKEKVQEYIRGTEMIQERKALVQQNLETVKTEIHNAVEMLHVALQRQERELVTEIEELAATSRDHLDTQHNNITSNMDRMQQAIEFAEGLVKRKSTLEIIATKAGLDERFDRLNETKVKMNPEVAVEGNFIPSEAATTIQLGHIRKIIDPEKSTVEVEENFADSAITGKETTFSFTTRNQFGRACYNSDLHFRVIVTPDRHGQEVALPVQVKDKLNGEYSVSFTPQVAGEHEVSVKVGESDVNGSPFVFQAKPRGFVPVKVFGKKGSRNGEFSYPRCVAVNIELNEIAVTDGRNCRIQILDRDGNYLRKFGKVGSGRGMFQVPVGITYDNQNNIIVSDYKNHTLSVFTNDGTFLRNLVTKGNQDAHLTYPAALSTTDEGNIIVADNDNKCIQVFSPDGRLLLKFGDTGNEKLQDPWACVYHQDHYIVTDRRGRCINLYDRRGQYVRKFSARVDDERAAFEPWGLTGTKCGNIIVTDYDNDRLVMLRLDGKVIATVGTQGEGLGQFIGPSDVSLLSDNLIIVCDNNNCRLQTLQHH